MPYRTAAPAPDVDPRVSQAIVKGLKARELGLLADKAKIEDWFNGYFFDQIEKRVAEGGKDSVLMATSQVGLFCHMSFMKNKEEVIQYLFLHFVSKVKGLTAKMAHHESTGSYMTVQW